jgi:hypothetical protein
MDIRGSDGISNVPHRLDLLRGDDRAARVAIQPQKEATVRKQTVASPEGRSFEFRQSPNGLSSSGRIGIVDPIMQCTPTMIPLGVRSTDRSAGQIVISGSRNACRFNGAICGRLSATHYALGGHYKHRGGSSRTANLARQKAGHIGRFQ